MSKFVIGLESLNLTIEQMKSGDLSIPLSRAGLLVERDAKKNITGWGMGGNGELRNSIITNVHDKQVEIGTNVYYAPYVEYGTGLFGPAGQRIYPRHSKALHWVDRDGEHFAKSVKGMKPRPFMHPALTQNRTKIIEIFRNYFRGLK